MSATKKIPLPSSHGKSLAQGEVNSDLYEAVKKEVKRVDRPGGKIPFCKALEYGLQIFLIESNPKKARELGIIED